ncbi:MAG: type II secretion system protein [Eubacterium sp.]|nr:type II secretion system protein [Eubacterium sp.]
MMKVQSKQTNKGYTLVELMVIIAIITILASMIGMGIIRYLEKGRQAKDIYHASLIKDALAAHAFPSDFQGRDMYYTDPETGETEVYRRGWVYVDKDEIRCSDQSTALAIIDFGLVNVSADFEENLAANEGSPYKWFPSGPDGDYVRRSGIDEYVFRNELKVKARNTWNTYQLDVYQDAHGDIYMGASASNAIRTDGHEKDTETASLFAKKLGFYDAKITPIGEQYNDD